VDETSTRIVHCPEKIECVRLEPSHSAEENRKWRECSKCESFYVPPKLTYPRKRLKESISFGAPPNTVFHCQDRQDKGWMDSEMFCGWKRHFFSVVKPIPQ
jgi:hypothetical protein